MKPYRLTLFITLFLLIFSIPGFTYSKDTHKELNKKALEISIVDNYLKNNLAFSEGIEEKISGEDGKKFVYDWIMDGGETEDDGIRFRNHFHNPLEEDWNEAGLWGIFDSSILWAQNLKQEWSWKNAREYYHLALTSATKEERDQNFANLFRALGQVMHLIEDSSVPAHSRNDGHVLYNYETWVEGADLDSFLANPRFFNEDILDEPPNPLAPIPIARIVDTDIYTGGNPGVGIGERIGLSEYANINFLSKDTMFTRDFPHPAKNEVELWTDNEKQYLRKKDDAEGEKVEHLAAVSGKYWYRPRHFPNLGWLFVGLDGKCYEEYASNLVPRAAGYSAGLLNYFFRGKLDAIIVPAYSGVPNERELKVTNKSDENMKDGTLTFLYENENGEYIELKKQSGVKIDAGKEYEGEFRFNIPQEMVANYILVFRGKLGQEEDAVVGKVWKIVLEDTFIHSSWPDRNFSKHSHIMVTDQIMWGEKGELSWDKTYTYIKLPSDPGYEHIHLYVKQALGAWYCIDWVEILVYQVASEAFSTDTLVWNNRPEDGALIWSQIFTDMYDWWGLAGTWITVPLSGATAIRIEVLRGGFQLPEEWHYMWEIGEAYDYSNIGFASTENDDPALRPRLTEGPY